MFGLSSCQYQRCEAEGSRFDDRDTKRERVILKCWKISNSLASIYGEFTAQ